MPDATPPWYKRRLYPHFDRPIGPERSAALVTDPAWVKKHAFLPFLNFTIEEPRYRPKEGKTAMKPREVAFASHADSQVFAYYSFVLNQAYEKVLFERGISNSVLAYRKFKPPRCNIHFAEDVFAHVATVRSCTAVAFDVEKFFDNISHAHLKRAWREVLDVTALPDDHYAVFKAITRYATVEKEDLFKAFGIGLRRQQKWRGPICTPEQFRTIVRGGKMIKPHPPGAGIPQGSPISAVLSNLVMLGIDTAMADAADQCGAMYRRYSDDILIVGSAEAVTKLETRLGAGLKELGLALNAGKTTRSIFCDDASGVLKAKVPLQYLGFTYDGERVLVRSKTLSKYMRRMKAAVRSTKRAAVKAAGKGGSRKLRRQDLYTRFSHLGARQSIKKAKGNEERKSNFLTYSKRAALIMSSDAIRRQLAGHWPRLNALIKMADEKD